MNVDEAKKFLSQYLEKFFVDDEECPLVWVGDLLEETKEEYAIQGTVYAGGEDPEEDAATFWVNKSTGDVRSEMPPPPG